jgi:ABC-type sugar transport system ATPase subunit
VNCLLSVEQLTKTFGATRALENVSFTVGAGERIAVLGENGAGKSTLMKVIAGAYRPDSGTMTLAGQPYTPSSPADAITAGVAIVYQEPSYFPRLSVTENIFSGRAPTKRVGHLDWASMRAASQDLLERFGLPRRLASLPMSDLSFAERQLALIARAVDMDARLLILDEPTSILTASEAGRLFAALGGLSDQGVPIVYITHRFGELHEVAQRFLVLRDGRLEGDLESATVNDQAILELMSGRSIDTKLTRRRTDCDRAPVLDIDAVTVADKVRDASLVIGRGEIVGLYGLVGSGRTELALSIFGELPASSGSFCLEGNTFEPKSAKKSFERAIAYLPEDRKVQGLFHGRNVRENLSAAHLSHLVRNGGIVKRRAEEKLVRRWIDYLRIKAPTSAYPVADLSGGHQLKVLLARVLAAEPRLLILDEPTRGIDVATKLDIQREVLKAADAGMAVLLISSELPEVLSLSDRVYVMREGAIVGEFGADTMSEKAIIAATIGLS